MREFKSMNSGDLKTYLYQSKAKIDWLYQQIQTPKEKTTLRWKIDLKVLSWEREKESLSEINNQDKLDAVVAALEERQLIGPPESRKPYIKGIFPMRWGIFADEEFRLDTDGPLVYFSGLVDGLLLGLGGSSVHIGNPYGIGGTSSRSSTVALCKWLRCGLDSGECPHPYSENEMSEIPEAMAWANNYLKPPTQEVDLVAKVLWRGKEYALDPQDREVRGEVILGTPLCVSQVDRKFVD